MGIFVFLFFLSIVGLFTLIALITPGGAGWFLYAFLLPFWGCFRTPRLARPWVRPWGSCTRWDSLF